MIVACLGLLQWQKERDIEKTLALSIPEQCVVVGIIAKNHGARLSAVECEWIRLQWCLLHQIRTAKNVDGVKVWGGILWDDTEPWSDDLWRESWRVTKQDGTPTLRKFVLQRIKR